MKLDFTRPSSGVKALFVLVPLCIFYTSIAYAEDAPSFSVGVFGGFAASMTGEAVKGYEKTEWETGAAYGGSFIYRLPNGLAFELFIEQFQMQLEEEGEDLGTLKVTPVLLLVKYQGMPKNYKGITFHAEIGGGFASSEFEKGDYFSGDDLDISNDDAFIFEFGAGVDYFLNKAIALTLDGRFVTGNIDSTWGGPGGSEDFTYYASNFQGLVGIRLWF